MREYVLTVAYKGTSYCGWQVQPGKKTVQGTIQEAFIPLCGVRADLTGCSRTDSGVHAREFVAKAAAMGMTVPAEKLPAALNTLLPPDIAVTAAYDCPGSFHPRYDACGKEYVYLVRNSGIRDPFTEDICWNVPKRLDEAALSRICGELAGKRDFRAFMATGSKITDTVRTVYAFDVRRSGEMLEFTVSADGFLYNMVRIMVGTAVDIALGTKNDDMSRILESGDRSMAGRTAPAKGLCLNRVFYPESIRSKDGSFFGIQG